MRRRIHAWLLSLVAPRQNPAYERGFAAGYVHGVGEARAEAHRLKAAEYRQMRFAESAADTLLLPPR